VVARDLLGAHLVRRLNDAWLEGIIVETEAYHGEQDQACHARAGLTPRTQVMYGAPGHAYVYFTYGAHWMLNVVTEPEGQASAVLIRGMVPCRGLEHMARLRPPPVHPVKKGQPKGNQTPGNLDAGNLDAGKLSAGILDPRNLCPGNPGMYKGWTDGPAKLCQALDIDGRLNGADLLDAGGGLFVQDGEAIPDDQVTTGPRVGINSVPEPWKSMPWRFMAAVPARVR